MGFAEADELWLRHPNLEMTGRSTVPANHHSSSTDVVP